MSPRQRPPRGYIMAYLLVGITAMSLVAVAVSRSGDDQAERRFVSEAQRVVLHQGELVRAQILLCGTMYPGGNNGSGFRVRYPAAPVSGLVRDLECPGVPSGGNRNLWSGARGVTLPPPPRGMQEWRYANDATSMRIWITADTTMALALERAAPQWQGAQWDATNRLLTLELVR